MSNYKPFTKVLDYLLELPMFPSVLSVVISFLDPLIWALNRVLKYFGINIDSRGKVMDEVLDDINMSESNCGFNTKGPNLPQPLEIDFVFESKTPVKVDIVGLSLRVGLGRNSLTMHNIVWGEEISKSSPENIKAGTIKPKENGKVKVEFVPTELIYFNNSSDNPTQIWIDGTIKFSSKFGTRERRIEDMTARNHFEIDEYLTNKPLRDRRNFLTESMCSNDVADDNAGNDK